MAWWLYIQVYVLTNFFEIMFYISSHWEAGHIQKIKETGPSMEKNGEEKVIQNGWKSKKGMYNPLPFCCCFFQIYHA